MDNVKVGKPFAIQAAKASWMASIIAIVVMMYGNSAGGPKGSFITLMVTVGVALLLMVAGIVCGVIGLAGVKLHGTKGIRTPSIVGIALNAGMLGLIAVSIVSGFQGAKTRSQTSPWYPFESRTGGFSVLFPVEPRPVNTSPNPPSDRISWVTFAAERDKITYVSTYLDLPKESIENRDPSAFLALSSEVAIKNIQGNLVDRKNISIQGYPGIEDIISTSNEENTIVIRSYLVGLRVYQLSAWGGKKNMNSRSYVKFFDSFQLHKE